MDTQALLNFDATAREWLRAVAESFGLPASSFKALLGVAEDEVPASRIEAIQYTLPGGCHTSCREHIDRGLLTLIYSDSGQGLQVQDQSGSWIDVTAPRGSLVVLAGYTLERATCGLIRASRHRVVLSGDDGAMRRNVLVYKLRAQDSAALDLYPQLQALADCFGAPPLDTLCKSSIGVKELMHFFHSTHTSVNAVSTASSASPPNSTPSTPGAAATPPAPSTPSRFDALGNLPRSVGRSRPALRNFCKHGQREALRRASCKRPRASSQEAFGRKRGRADETTSEANRMTVVTATGLAATPDLLQGDSEMQATATTNEQTNASCFAAVESSAEVTHVSTSGCIMLNQGTAQTSDQPTPKQPQIDIQLPSPALHKDIITMQVVTPSALQLNITASQSVLVRDVQNALMQQFVGMGHEEWIDGKLLCDGEILSCNRTVRYYVDEEQQYKEPFGSIYWVVDCLVNTGIEFLHGIASCSVVGMP